MDKNKNGIRSVKGEFSTNVISRSNIPILGIQVLKNSKSYPVYLV